MYTYFYLENLFKKIAEITWKYQKKDHGIAWKNWIIWAILILGKNNGLECI